MLTPKQVEKRLSKKAKIEEERWRKQIERRIEKTLEAAVSEGKVNCLGGIIKASYSEQDRAVEIEYLQKHKWNVFYETKETSGYSMSTRSETYGTEHHYRLKPKQ